MSDDNQQPIIIRRKRRGHAGGHHGGAWKVALADFMTAMMAFFLVMWLTGQKPEVKQAVAGYFRDPGKFQQKGKEGVLKGSSSMIPSDNQPMAITKSKAQNSGEVGEEQQKLIIAAKRIMTELEKQPIFQELKKNISLQLTTEGLRIILNESEDDAAFFEPGSAKLVQRSATILMIIARELGNLENRLVMEGHTDASYNGRAEYSNWELSADRANAARQLMEVSGLHKNQVREVRGFADQFPMITNNPNDARNRRITIVVLYKSSDSQYHQMELGGNLFDEATQG